MRAMPAWLAIQTVKDNSMRLLSLAILFVICCSSLTAQQTERTIEGTVTFVTATNVYVRFDNTELIDVGGRLQLNGSDCLLISQKSTSSVVCTILNDCAITVDTVVTYSFTEETTVEEDPDTDVTEDDIPKTSVEQGTVYKDSDYEESIRGRVAVGSYNTFSNLRDNSGRFLALFSLDADHISDSKFSVDTYVAYRGLTISTDDYTGRTSLFNVYNLNVVFDANEDLSIAAGRKINPKANSVGANDGVMIEHYFNNFYVGAMGGFRPDFVNYGFNSDLLQYGGYIGIETGDPGFYSQTSLGAMEQTNSGATDRRYVFFQHSSTINSALNLFSSMELDIYSENGGGSRLTNLYLSARYRFSRAVNASISYDSRKQIVYYESFQTEIERILDDDLARQGFRIRLNVRPAKILWIGASYSSRFQSDQQNQSDNIYLYTTVSSIPGIGGRLNISYNQNTSRYLTGNILSARYYREIVSNDVQGEVYYRRADYDYDRIDDDLIQNYFGAGLIFRFSRTWQLNVSGEYATFGDENTTRIYARLTKRFYSKRK